MDSDKILVQGDPDIADLIPRFLAHRKADVETVRAAIRNDEYERIQFIGHSMKGVGGGYGFDAITEIGARIEQGAIDQNRSDIELVIDELVDYLERVEVVYD